MCPATGELRPPPASTMRDLPHTSACNESAQPCASRANWERVSMNAPTQSQKAQHFRALHAGPRMLVLPNAWDVISARLIEDEHPRSGVERPEVLCLLRLRRGVHRNPFPVGTA